ncbi:hypothetical protein FB107DRAFT_252662, partial [Schizophyllum commune]
MSPSGTQTSGHLPMRTMTGAFFSPNFCRGLRVWTNTRRGRTSASESKGALLLNLLVCYLTDEARRKKRQQVKEELCSLQDQLVEAQQRIQDLEEQLRSAQLNQPPSPSLEQEQHGRSTGHDCGVSPPSLGPVPEAPEQAPWAESSNTALDHPLAQEPRAGPLLDLTACAFAFPAAESLDWPHSNVRALLPYLPGALTSKGTGGGNVLEEFSDSRDAHDLVVHLAGGGNEVDKLADLAIGHMGVGKVVVIDGCPPSVPYEAGNPTGDIGFWEKTMRCNKKKLYESMSLDEFCSSIDDLGRIRCALDLKPGIRLFDPLVEKLAEGHQEIRSPSHSQKVRDYDWIPLAALQAEDWCLAHQNGFLTSSHADAFGLCTSIEVVGEGAKLWFVLAFEDPADEGITREELLRRGSLVVAHGEKDDGASNVLLIVKDGSFRIVGSCIVLRAGQKILQPPGQAHLVYTPIHCTTLGKQFLCYATLHLTEYARAVEFKTRGRGTNQDLHVLQYMLLQMAAALPARVAAGQ